MHFDDPGTALVRLDPAAPLKVYGSHNIEASLKQPRTPGSGDVLRRAFNTVEARKVAREETAIWRSFDLCTAVSSGDAAVIRASGARRVELCPNGTDPVERLELAPRAPDEPLRLLFVGSGNYAPYERGLAWLVRRVLPQIRAHGSVQLDVVGAPPSRPVSAEGVRYLGRVPSVVPHYREAHAVVIPVFEGSGTRLKAVEAAAFGRPIVSTSLGVEGLPLEPGRHYLEANDAESFSAAVLQLARWSTEAAPYALERMLSEARDAVQALTWPRIADDLAALYRSAVAERAAGLAHDSR